MNNASIKAGEKFTGRNRKGGGGMKKLIYVKPKVVGVALVHPC